jgi:hypothetical protein
MLSNGRAVPQPGRPIMEIRSLGMEDASIATAVIGTMKI